MAERCERCGKEILYVTSAYQTVQYQCLCSTCYNQIIQFEYKSIYKERIEYVQLKSPEEVKKELNKSKREFAEFISGQQSVFAHIFNAFSSSCKQIGKLDIKENAFDIILEQLIDTYLLHIIENDEKKTILDNLITGDTCRAIIDTATKLPLPYKRIMQEQFTKTSWLEYIKESEEVTNRYLQCDPYWDEFQQRQYGHAMTAYNERIIQSKASGHSSTQEETYIRLEYQHILLEMISTKALLFLRHIIIYFEVSNLFNQPELKVIIDNLFATGLTSTEIALRLYPLHHQYFRYDFTYELSLKELEELLIIYDKNQLMQLPQEGTN